MTTTTTTAPALGSILLASTDPDRLRAWYRDAFAPEQSLDSNSLVLGEVLVVFDGRDDIGVVNAEPGRAILNFHVDDARATAAHLDELAVTWVAEVQERPAGFFGTLVDPDGNYLQIIQFKAGHV